MTLAEQPDSEPFNNGTHAWPPQPPVDHDMNVGNTTLDRYVS